MESEAILAKLPLVSQSLNPKTLWSLGKGSGFTVLMMLGLGCRV